MRQPAWKSNPVTAIGELLKGAKRSWPCWKSALLPRDESLFYYFKLDDYIPENHLLRLVDQHISLALLRERLKDTKWLQD